MDIMSQNKKCSPTCNTFRCAKKAIIRRQNDVWCRWIEDACNIANCAYAICSKRRLLPGGVCGETVRRKTADKQPEEVTGPPVKIRGKTLRRIGDKEIF